MRVLLVSNYAADRQWSMLRFAALLDRELSVSGHQVAVVQPARFFGALVSERSRLHKWLAYLDKFLIFPLQLRFRSKRWDITHICDHSNSLYRRWIKSRATVVTCHDLLAVRGALGEPTFCPATAMGRRLQAAILKNLAAIPWVACDSEATLLDFSRLTNRPPGPGLRKILLGFEGLFEPVQPERAQQELGKLGLAIGAYLLHVGSSQPRKNRECILRVAARLGTRWQGKIAFAGEALTAAQRQLASDLGLASRVVEITKANDYLLATIYSGAHALLFPSFCEGFGWPILEAQACGCPVITADNTSLAEVAGDGAVVLDAENLAGMAEAVLRLESFSERQELVRQGFANVSRFTVDQMVNAYISLYQDALAAV